jgi:hypothetical protein
MADSCALLPYWSALIPKATAKPTVVMNPASLPGALLRGGSAEPNWPLALIYLRGPRCAS